MLINSIAPDFSLPDLIGQIHRLSDELGRVVVVNFWSAECPWSERADQHLKAILNQFPDQVVLMPVASNLNESSEIIALVLQERGLKFVLLDEGCLMADAWGAQITPHVFVIDQAGILRYQGAVDDTTFRKRSPEHFYVEQAVLALLNGKLPKVQETQPYGCTIVRII